MDVDSNDDDMDLFCLCYDWDLKEGKCIGRCELPNYRLQLYDFPNATRPVFGVGTIWDKPADPAPTEKVPDNGLDDALTEPERGKVMLCFGEKKGK